MWRKKRNLQGCHPSFHKFSPIVSVKTESDDPICKLSIDERSRICAQVFGSNSLWCVSNKNHENISLLATALKLYTFFLYLPKNEKTQGDTSLDVTGPLWSLRNPGIRFSRIFQGDETLGENVSNKNCRAFNYLQNDISFFILTLKLR